MRPSDWVRSQLSAAVEGRSLPGVDREGSAPSPDVSPSVWPTDPSSSARIHQLTLQSEDIDQLDRVAAAGGFRSRPAALRFLLRAHGSKEGHAALRRLPETVPALIEANVTLQTAVRLAAGFASLQPAGSRGSSGALDPAVRREISAHLERASRVVAALQPLLAPRR